MTAIIIKGRQIISGGGGSLPSGLLFAFKENLNLSTSNIAITLPSFATSFTNATFAFVFTMGQQSTTQDLLNGLPQGEIPRLLVQDNSFVQSYFVSSGGYALVDSNANTVLLNGQKNVFITTINGTNIDSWMNGVKSTAKVTVGSVSPINMNRQYRLSGYIDNSRFFLGTYNFFGIWNQVLSDSEILNLSNLLIS